MPAAQYIEVSSCRRGPSRGAWMQAGRRPPWQVQLCKEKRASVRTHHTALLSACDPGGPWRERKRHPLQSRPPSTWSLEVLQIGDEQTAAFNSHLTVDFFWGSEESC